MTWVSSCNPLCIIMSSSLPSWKGNPDAKGMYIPLLEMRTSQPSINCMAMCDKKAAVKGTIVNAAGLVIASTCAVKSGLVLLYGLLYVYRRFYLAWL